MSFISQGVLYLYFYVGMYVCMYACKCLYALYVFTYMDLPSTVANAVVNADQNWPGFMLE